MQIQNRLFSYPILDKITNDYQSSTFDVTLSQSVNASGRILSMEAKTNNAEIIALINNKQASVVYHIECKSTAYRHLVYGLINGVTDIPVDASKIQGTLEICSLIIATEDVPAWKNSDWDSIFSSYTFNIRKGSIIALGEQYKLKIFHNLDDIANTNSIFAVARDMTTKSDAIRPDYSHDKLYIWVPDKYFQDYNVLNSSDDYKYIVHSSIAMPVLAGALDIIKVSTTDDFQSGKRWFQSIVSAMGKLGYSEQDLIDNKITSLELAQILINFPLNNIFQIYKKEEE